MLLFLILISSVHCQSDSQSAGSHDSAYESIISQYYTNDPYFGSGPPSQRYSTKEEALDRLKQIINGWVIIIELVVKVCRSDEIRVLTLERNF